MNLWFPNDSYLYKSYEYMLSNYDDNANYISIIVWNKNNSNILTPHSLSSIYKLEQLFYEFTIDLDDKEYKYTSFCARDYIESPVILYLFLINLMTDL